MRLDGTVVEEHHSWRLTEQEWIDRIVSYFYDPLDEECPLALVVEDIPHAVGYRKLVKRVCQLQGRIVQAMANVGVEDRIVFVPPQLWQMSFPGVYRGKAQGALKAAESLGYTPPQLLTPEVKGKDRMDARKTMTDHVDAFLIGRWAVSQFEKYETLDDILNNQKRLERYGS
jgi:hypothetical protein